MVETKDVAEERRGAQRQRVLKGAKIVYGNYMFVIDCAIRDISASGARLRLPNVSPVPANFHLFLKENQTICAAHLVWRDGRDMGVAFDEAPKSVLDSPDPRLKRFAYM